MHFKHRIVCVQRIVVRCKVHVLECVLGYVVRSRMCSLIVYVPTYKCAYNAHAYVFYKMFTNCMCAYIYVARSRTCSLIVFVPTYKCAYNAHTYVFYKILTDCMCAYIYVCVGYYKE